MRLIDADKLVRETSHLLFFDVNDRIVFETFIENAPTVDIKTEVAREIFAEIKKVATINLHTGEIKITYPDYIKLKNKYTKEGVGE